MSCWYIAQRSELKCLHVNSVNENHNVYKFLQAQVEGPRAEIILHLFLENSILINKFQ